VVVVVMMDMENCCARVDDWLQAIIRRRRGKLLDASGMFQHVQGGRVSEGAGTRRGQAERCNEGLQRFLGREAPCKETSRLDGQDEGL
jgi:hypothetical protein